MLLIYDEGQKTRGFFGIVSYVSIDPEIQISLFSRRSLKSIRFRGYLYLKPLSSSPFQLSTSKARSESEKGRSESVKGRTDSEKVIYLILCNHPGASSGASSSPLSLSSRKSGDL